MDIKHVNDNSKGSFKAFEDGKQAGVLGYRWAGEDRISIDHTEVIPVFEGQGLAKRLLMEAVAFAREKNLKIIPNCSYARRVFERTEEIKDVLYVL